MAKASNGSTGENLCRDLVLSIDHLQAHLESVATSTPNWTRLQWAKQEREWRQAARHMRHSQRRIEYLIRHCTLGVVVAKRHLK